MNDHDNPDDQPWLTGYAPMAAYLTGRGFKIGKSTLSKVGAPSANAGLPDAEKFPIDGYWGRLPLSNPRRLLDWAYKRLRPCGPSPIAASAQPLPLAPVPTAPASKAFAAPSPPPPCKRRRPAKVQPAHAATDAR